MDKAKYEEAKKVLEEITEELKDQSLSDEDRKTLEMHAAELSGIMLSPWLPADWGRRLIMAAIVGLGVYGLVVRNYEVIFWWLALPFFSPRIVGETALLVGKLRGMFSTRE